MSKAVPVHGTCDPRFEAVRKIFEQSIADGVEIGAAVCITLDGKPVVDLWGGWLDPEKTTEFDADTLVNVYSTTKGMTAICAAQLAEGGELDVDAPVASYWPEFAAAGKEEIPVRWLLSHQAGLPAVSKPLSAQDLFDWHPVCDALAEQEPWWEPGSKHGYHALTYGHLVGEVIRRITGKSVGTFFRENVAGPLEADVWIGLPESEDARTSDLHGDALGGDIDPALIPEGPLKDMFLGMRDPSTMTGKVFGNPGLRGGMVNTRAWRAAEIPAANGHGSARGLARIYGALARGGEVDGVRILEREGIERATTEQAFGPDAVLGGLPMRFGLGFMLRQDMMPWSPSTKSFGHPGAGGSIGMACPETGVGFGYVPNRMHVGLVGAAGAFAMLNAFFEAL